MSKFKIGDRVRIIEDSSNDFETKEYIGSVGVIGNITCDVKYRYLYMIIGLKDYLLNFAEDELELVGKTLETLEEGDTVIKGDGYKKDVLAVLGGRGDVRCYVMSRGYKEDKDNGKKMGNCTWTAYELNKSGFKPLIEENTKEMTVKEVSEALGYEVKIVK